MARDAMRDKTDHRLVTNRYRRTERSFAVSI
jgi:hypothetical protein